MKKFFCALFFLLLSGCSGEIPDVAIVNGWSQIPKTTVHYVVQQDDTIYSIAWIFGLDYQQIAKVNHLTSPNFTVTPGQTLKIVPPQNRMRMTTHNEACENTVKVETLSPTNAFHAASSTKPTNNLSISRSERLVVSHDTSTENTQFTPNLTQSSHCAGIDWNWPAAGKLSDHFSAGSLHKGIDIFGKSGSPVLAAASGKVVYAGNGLRGYGELIIIKHNAIFLSAYGHNQKLLVKEGQEVRGGQLIAKMGATRNGKVMLHFELRKSGKPVNPLLYLPDKTLCTRQKLQMPA
jgi:lipoprotein NlpD